MRWLSQINWQQILNKMISWRIAKISERNFIYIISLVVGIFSGLAALVLKKLIHLVEVQLTGWFDANTFSFLYLAYPILGITLTWLFVKYIVKDDIGHGVSKILFAISRKRGRLKPHNTWSSMVASSMTIGLGGSVGAEAPIVLTGASIGSNLARIFKLNYRYVTLMIGCGAAGAIAGIFKAPIAGIVFTLEVLMLDMTMAYLIPLLISSITAASLSYIFMGSAMVMKFELVNSFSVNNIGFYILLGVFAGLVSFYFTRSIMWQEKQFKKLVNPGVRLLIGGTILSFLVFMLPPLWGEGYTSIIKIFSGHGTDMLNNSIFFGWKDNSYLVMVVLVMILLLKVVATAATTGGGGIGGIFAPTLFMGAVSGFLLARALNTFFQLQLPEENFALAGMAGLMAGVMHAPLTAIFLTAEITGGYGLFIPLIITSTVSYLTIMRFEPHSIYTKRLAERGDLITHHKDKAVLKLMQTRNLIETDFEILSPEATLRDLSKAISRSHRNLFPVVDEQGILIGMVKLSEVRTLIFESDLYDRVRIKDLMYMPKHFVSPRDSMEEVVENFETSGRYNLAVIDNGKYIGFLSRAKVFSEYRDNIRDISSD
jgi:chloride channel protein, CIC family